MQDTGFTIQDAGCTPMLEFLRAGWMFSHRIRRLAEQETWMLENWLVVKPKFYHYTFHKKLNT